MSAAELHAYQRRHPHLFPEVGQRPAPKGAGVPRSVSNGYASEALFQADAVEQLILRGWHVQETLKGSAGNSAVYVTPGWPDLVLYRAPRRIWFAELKQPGRKPSDAQLACHARLRAAGFRVVVAYFLSDLLAVEAEERA
ncbi:VRR-NUC domain-containing protein [Deinococcus multiflagellatus]|uniref:VRR-NUC domain-containing protein n=1 Tax=Deinococcus multiflagellatus TaxID=1656887 RepID=A0ABW1ZIS7_9DEIO|nr:VRR-NUC domain-containing protein [Deinococcus multiflagellatus]MBZ9713775.1 VRR-NUC domain-containing protein [Deinococcus multiflagellatus]